MPHYYVGHFFALYPANLAGGPPGQTTQVANQPLDFIDPALLGWEKYLENNLENIWISHIMFLSLHKKQYDNGNKNI